jgi:predicted DNA-binding transcriptional regulator AlpA
MIEQLLTPGEVAAKFTVAESTLCNWRKAGTGPRFVRLGRRIAYPESAVVEWLRDQAVSA